VGGCHAGQSEYACEHERSRIIYNWNIHEDTEKEDRGPMIRLTSHMPCTTLESRPSDCISIDMSVSIVHSASSRSPGLGLGLATASLLGLSLLSGVSSLHASRSRTPDGGDGGDIESQARRVRPDPGRVFRSMASVRGEGGDGGINSCGCAANDDVATTAPMGAA
jgi:hypothetical protein